MKSSLTLSHIRRAASVGEQGATELAEILAIDKIGRSLFNLVQDGRLRRTKTAAGDSVFHVVDLQPVLDDLGLFLLRFFWFDRVFFVLLELSEWISWVWVGLMWVCFTDGPFFNWLWLVFFCCSGPCVDAGFAAGVAACCLPASSVASKLWTRSLTNTKKREKGKKNTSTSLSNRHHSGLFASSSLLQAFFSSSGFLVARLPLRTKQRTKQRTKKRSTSHRFRREFSQFSLYIWV